MWLHVVVANDFGRIHWLVAFFLHIFDKFNKFIPKKFENRTECLNWLFWQMASAPYLGGGFGHFYAYAPEKYEYPIDRFAMEVKRQLDVLDKLLSDKNFICCEKVGFLVTKARIFMWFSDPKYVIFMWSKKVKYVVKKAKYVIP